MTPEEIKKKKLQAIKSTMKHLEKQLKQEGVVKILGEEEHKSIESTPSGSLMLDLALGVNGLPKGRVIEFFGAESSGKTLISTKAMAEVQKLNGVCALVDAENSFDPEFAAKLGLNPDELIISQVNIMEDALEVVDALIDSKSVDMIVVDSVAALTPRDEAEGNIDKQTIGLQARILSKFLRRIVGKCNASDHKTTVIFINQIRDAIGVKVA